MSELDNFKNNATELVNIAERLFEENKRLRENIDKVIDLVATNELVCVPDEECLSIKAKDDSELRCKEHWRKWFNGEEVITP